jgi:hypothetical protein
MPEFKGSCLCGSVTYTASADPLFKGLCHCTNCQKVTGSAFASVIAFPAPALTVTGTTAQFDWKGDSGQPTHRWFCPACGSTVKEVAEVMKDIVMVPTGTLSDPAVAAPDMQIYCDSAQSWAVLPGVHAVPKMP